MCNLALIFFIIFIISYINNKKINKPKIGGVKEYDKPFINLDYLLNQKKLKTLNSKLIKDIETTNSKTAFIANKKKHGFAISLYDRTFKPKNEKLCDNRKKRNSYYWEPNSNYSKFYYLVEFIKDLNIFDDIGLITIIINEKNEQGVEHLDHECKDWVSEFIWLRTNNKKLFYIKNKNKNKKFYVDGNMIWFDDMHCHNISPVDEQTFSIRVDGIFNNKMRNYIYKNGNFKYKSHREIFLNNKNNNKYTPSILQE